MDDSETPDGVFLTPENMSSAGFARVDALNYAPEALGSGRWGPVSVAHVVGFCRDLHRLQKGGVRILLFCSERHGVAANTALLLGAYMVLELGMSADEAAERLPSKVLPLRFPRPWARGVEWHENSVTVMDCLQGLHFASRHGWLDYSRFDQKEWKRNLVRYDASLVCELPLGQDGRTLKIWAMADPVTSVADPTVRPVPPAGGFIFDYLNERSMNRRSSDPVVPPHCEPATSVFRSEAAVHWNRQTSTTSSDPTVGKEVAAGQQAISTRSIGTSWLEEERTHRWGLEQHGRLSSIPVRELKRRGKATLPDFGVWLQAQGCRRLVRLNRTDERNLPPCGSYGDYFSHWDLDLHKLEFEDCTVPSPAIVRSFIKLLDSVCEEVRQDPEVRSGVVAVHCTAGLGRTMTLLGALVKERSSMAGGAWLGWARLCRPGSVQTLEQESFLKRGRPQRGGDDAAPPRLSSFHMLLRLLGGCGRQRKRAPSREDGQGPAACRAPTIARGGRRAESPDTAGKEGDVLQREEELPEEDEENTVSV